MSLLPEVKRCPCCDCINLIKVNEIRHENPFRNLKNWSLKKKFNCRKCKEELGIFTHRSSFEEKVIWLNMIECENRYYDKLNILEKRKTKLVRTANKKYYETLKDIKNIQNQISLDKIKLKIKFKIQKKEILSRDIY